MSKARRYRKSQVSAERFVTVWTLCNSTAEVAAKTGMDVFAVRGRAHRLRRLGVNLKPFPKHHVRPRKRLDVEALNDLVRQVSAVVTAPEERPAKEPLIIGA